MKPPPYLAAPTRSNTRITANTKVAELANNTILDSLDGPELVVYLRLIAETKRQGTRRIQVINAALFRRPQRVAEALGKLEDRGLIKISYDDSVLRRTIEVSP